MQADKERQTSEAKAERREQGTLRLAGINSFN